MKYFLLWIACFSILSISAQSVTATTDKSEYFSHEVMVLSFTADFKPDSIQEREWKEVTKVSGPSTMNSMSMVNGETSTKTVQSYRVKATSAGKLKIKSPIFWYEGETITADDIKITVLESTLTEEEILAIEDEEFRKKKEKPIGSIRVTFDGNRAYLEEYQFFGWTFKRWLNEEEIRAIQGLKKSKK